MPEVPREAYEVAWRVACSYGELIPEEAERLMSVSGLTPHMALNRAQVETIVHRVAPILFDGAEPVERSDLPVGQQSKELAEEIKTAAAVLLRQYDLEFDASHLSWQDFESAAREVVEAVTPILVARVRAQAFADALELIAQHAIGVSPEPWLADAMDQERIPFGKVREALAEAAETPAAPAESVVAALPDVVGTPEHQEDRDAR